MLKYTTAMKNKLSYNFISLKYHPKCEDVPKETKCNWIFALKQINGISKYFTVPVYPCDPYQMVLPR